MKKLLEEIELHSRVLPDEVQQEVLDFIKFKESKLLEQKNSKLETAILSEAALCDWNNKEEDDAWVSFQ